MTKQKVSVGRTYFAVSFLVGSFKKSELYAMLSDCYKILLEKHILSPQNLTLFHLNAFKL